MAVLRPGLAQPSPVPSDRGGGGGEEAFSGVFAVFDIKSGETVCFLTDILTKSYDFTSYRNIR